MACISSWYIALVLLAAAIQIQAQSNVYQENNKASTESAGAGGIVAEEVVVESSLSVRPKPSVSNSRRVRSTFAYLFPSERDQLVLIRAKRQFHHHQHGNPAFGNPAIGNPSYGNPSYGNPSFGNPSFGNPAFARPIGYDTSQATAQSASDSNSRDSSSSGLAGAQAFQSGNFGATSSNAGTNSLSFGPFGPSGGFSNSGGQTYSLPNGQKLNIAYNNANSFTPGNNAHGQGSSIALSG